MREVQTRCSGGRRQRSPWSARRPVDPRLVRASRPWRSGVARRTALYRGSELGLATGDGVLDYGQSWTGRPDPNRATLSPGAPVNTACSLNRSTSLPPYSRPVEPGPLRSEPPDLSPSRMAAGLAMITTMPKLPTAQGPHRRRRIRDRRSTAPSLTPNLSTVSVNVCTSST